LVGLAAPASAQSGEPTTPAPDLDNLEMNFKVSRDNPLEVTAFLAQWSPKLGVAIVFDQTIRGQRLNFLTTDVTLSWGTAKKILDFHEIVIQEQPSGGRWIMY